MEKNKSKVVIVYEDNDGEIYEKPYVVVEGILPSVGEDILIRKAGDKATVEVIHAVVTDVLHECYIDSDSDSGDVVLDVITIYTEPIEAE